MSLRMTSRPSRAAVPVALLGVILLLGACVGLVSPQYRFGQVRVRVATNERAPVPGVLVVLYTGQREMGRVTTDSSGEHVFEEVVAGAYGVAINPPPGFVLAGGMPSFVDTLSVTQGSRHDVSFVLQPVVR